MQQATPQPKVIPFPGSSSSVKSSGPVTQQFKANSYPLRGGDSGTSRTVRYMRGMASGREGVLNPQVIALATQIVSAVPNRDATGEISAIFNWVKKNIRFQNEENERLQTPLVTTQLRAGDCDDHAMLMAALLRVLGYEVAFRTVAVGDNSDFAHVYAVVRNKRTGEWIPLDTTVKGSFPGWQVSNASRSRTFTPMGDDSETTRVDQAVQIINALNPIVAGVGSRIAHGTVPGVSLDIGTTLNTPNLGSVNGIPLSTIIWGGLIFTGFALATRKKRRR